MDVSPRVIDPRAPDPRCSVDTLQLIDLSADERPPLSRSLTIWLVETADGHSSVTVAGRLVTQRIPSADWNSAVRAAQAAAREAGADRIYVTRLRRRLDRCA